MIFPSWNGETVCKLEKELIYLAAGRTQVEAGASLAGRHFRRASKMPRVLAEWKV